MNSEAHVTFELDHLANEGPILARHVDILVKYILFVNGHIPCGYEDMKKRISEHRAQDENARRTARFLSAADEIFNGLARSICSCLVTEVVLVFGSTMFTPKFTVTIHLPEHYELDGCIDNWDDIVDPSGFPIQMVENFGHLSKAFDIPPGNVWFLLKVEETTVNSVSSVFRLDRRLSICSRGHHLQIRLLSSSASRSCNFSGFLPFSPARTTDEVHEMTDHSGIAPFSPDICKPLVTSATTNVAGAGHKVTCNSYVYFMTQRCLKGFR